jgi:lipoprotein-anchoring transpeptidase ErfK/SrfK
MKIGFAGLSRRQVVRCAAGVVPLALTAFAGDTINAGFFSTPWDQPRGPNPAFARQIVAYATHERPGTIIIDPVSHFLYFIHDAGRAIRYGVGVGAEGFVWSGRATVHSKQAWPDWYPPKELLARKPELRQHMVQLRSGMA